MRHLLARLELEGISIFSFKAVTRRLTEKIGLFPRGGEEGEDDPLNSGPVTQTCERSVFCLHMHTNIPARSHRDGKREQACARSHTKGRLLCTFAPKRPLWDAYA